MFYGCTINMEYVQYIMNDIRVVSFHNVIDTKILEFNMRQEKHRVETHHDGHKFEHHHENDLHRDHHEMAHGHMRKGYHEMMKDGGHEKEYIHSGEHGMMSGREVARELKMEGGGRQAKQHKQRMAAGMRDDTVYGKIPPRPGRIDS